MGKCRHAPCFSMIRSDQIRGYALCVYVVCSHNKMFFLKHNTPKLSTQSHSPLLRVEMRRMRRAAARSRGGHRFRRQRQLMPQDSRETTRKKSRTRSLFSLGLMCTYTQEAEDIFSAISASIQDPHTSLMVKDMLGSNVQHLLQSIASNTPSASDAPKSPASCKVEWSAQLLRLITASHCLVPDAVTDAAAVCMVHSPAHARGSSTWRQQMFHRITNNELNCDGFARVCLEQTLQIKLVIFQDMCIEPSDVTRTGDDRLVTLEYGSDHGRDFVPMGYLLLYKNNHRYRRLSYNGQSIIQSCPVHMQKFARQCMPFADIPYMTLSPNVQLA